MVHTPLLLALLFSWLTPVEKETMRAEKGTGGKTVTSASSVLYAEIGLAGALPEQVFDAGFKRMQRYGQQSRYLAIADMTQPSDARRLYVIDLDLKELVLRTYVAHGQGSGDRMATSFSNREGSHQTSLGLYTVGSPIVSPKHGQALLLRGLERGVNCQAEAREVIMHGADYVSESFVAEHGRLGRSWGCPAVSRQDMPHMLELLANGGLLYVHGKR